MPSRNCVGTPNGDSPSWMQSEQFARLVSRIELRQSRTHSPSTGVELPWSSVRLTMRSIESRKQYAITGRRLVNSGKASLSSVTFRLVGQQRRRVITGTFELARLWNFTARSRASRNTNRRKSCARKTTELWCARPRGSSER